MIKINSLKLHKIVTLMHKNNAMLCCCIGKKEETVKVICLKYTLQDLVHAVNPFFYANDIALSLHYVQKYLKEVLFL